MSSKGLKCEYYSMVGIINLYFHEYYDTYVCKSTRHFFAQFLADIHYVHSVFVEN